MRRDKTRCKTPVCELCLDSKHPACEEKEKQRHSDSTKGHTQSEHLNTGPYSFSVNSYVNIYGREESL